MHRVTMPQLGESVVEAILSRWLVKPGDRVGPDQPLAQIETDKANADLPSPVGGIVRELLVGEGDRVQVGAALAVIEEGDGAAKGVEEAPAAPAAAPPAEAPGDRAPAPTASPVVRRLARERGVDLNQVAGSGEHGRITRDDVLRHAQGGAPSGPTNGGSTGAPAPAAAAAASVVTGPPPPAPRPPMAPAAPGAYRVPVVRPEPGDEVIPFDRRRRLIAEHMVYSKQTAPHVTCVAEVDLHRVVRARKAHPEAERPSFTAYVAAALVEALRAVPRMNAVIVQTGDQIILRKAIHLGVAVDVEEGLVVPVIRNADRLSLTGLAAAIRDLAAQARKKALRPDDLAGATFTLSNPGTRGNLYGTAIINQPQVGILRMGEIEKRPTVVTSADGEDVIVVHPKMYLSLSYDHRVIDGVLGNDFLRRVRESLERGDFH